MSLSELQQQNDALKARLAELKQLSTSVQDLAEAKSTHDESAVRSAFETFDEDKSGFIDAHELQLLALELGQALSEAELKEAMTAIDKSGDGKISFDEFKAWFFDTARTVSPKGSLDLGLLRAKLILHRSTKLFQSLTVLAEEASSAAADRAGFNVIVQHGPEFEAKRKIAVSLETDVPAEIKKPWDHLAFTFTLKPKAGQAAATEEFVRGMLGSLLSRRQQLEFTHLGEDLAVTITVDKGNPPHVEQKMEKVNEFIKKHIHDLGAELTFPDMAATVLDLMASDRSKTFVELLATGFRFHAHSQRATNTFLQFIRMTTVAGGPPMHDRFSVAMADMLLNSSFKVSSDIVANNLAKFIDSTIRGGFQNKDFIRGWGEAFSSAIPQRIASSLAFMQGFADKFELGTNHYFQIGKVAAVKLTVEGWEPVASALRFIQIVQQLVAERAPVAPAPADDEAAVLA